MESGQHDLEYEHISTQEPQDNLKRKKMLTLDRRVAIHSGCFTKLYSSRLNLTAVTSLCSVSDGYTI